GQFMDIAVVVLICMIKDGIGTLIENQPFPLVRTRSSDHHQSRAFRPLHGGNTYAARSTVDQDRFSRFRSSFLKQGSVTCCIRRPNSRTLFETYIFGKVTEM